MGGACGVSEIGPRLRIKINPQLVDLLGVRPGHRPRVVTERAEVRHPGDGCQLGGTDLVGSPTGREGDGYRLDPVGHAFGRRPLLVEGLAVRVAAGAELDVRPVSARPTL